MTNHCWAMNSTGLHHLLSKETNALGPKFLKGTCARSQTVQNFVRMPIRASFQLTHTGYENSKISEMCALTSVPTFYDIDLNHCVTFYCRGLSSQPSVRYTCVGISYQLI